MPVTTQQIPFAQENIEKIIPDTSASFIVDDISPVIISKECSIIYGITEEPSSISKTLSDYQFVSEVMGSKNNGFNFFWPIMRDQNMLCYVCIFILTWQIPYRKY